jgi:hypothetical protein
MSSGSAFHSEGTQPVRIPNTHGHSRGPPPHAAHRATASAAAACLGGDTAFLLV